MSEDTEATRPLQRPDAGRDTERVTAPEEPSPAPAAEASAQRRAAPEEPPPATAPEASAQRGATAEEPAPGAPQPADRPPGGGAAGGGRSPLSAPVETLRQPESRAWLLLAAAALSLVNLVLLIAVLAAVTDDFSDRIIEVEGQRCLVVEEEDANVLYCQR